MKKLISFIIRAEKGLLKKPDINDGIYLTYNMLHKPAALGILGAIIGLEGYKENGVLPEYYVKLKDIPIGIAPVGDEQGNFQKTIITYNNTTGFASSESGGNLIITEQTLIKPSYKIFLLLDIEDKNQKKIYHNILKQEAEYLPYLGKNDYSMWWKREEVEEYHENEWGNFKKGKNLKFSSFFQKESSVMKQVVEAIGRKGLAEQKDNFYYFERIPVSFNEELFQYTMGNIVYSNVMFKETVEIKMQNIYELKNKNELIYMA